MSHDVQRPIEAAGPSAWTPNVFSRVPSWIYTDPDLYSRELERIFYGRHWCYVGLEAEIPDPRMFKTTKIGERSIIVTRDQHGEIHVLENRCAHRGVRFCRDAFGKTPLLRCPYHQWSYGLDGRLRGVPYRNGVQGHGGMGDEFNQVKLGLTRLRVHVRGGVIFASFTEDVEPFEKYLGVEVLKYFDRVFSGRPLKVLGYTRQRIPGNWKLMMENIKDPYHPALLHTWFVTFGLWSPDQTSRMAMDDSGRHACMISRRAAKVESSEVTDGVASYKAGMKLHDGRFLEVEPEAWWNGPTAVMMTIFPSLIIQQQLNSVSTRQILPVGADKFDFVWTHFGFAEDSPALTEKRLRQANLFGPAGFVSADDGEVIEFVQQGLGQNIGSEAISVLDGIGVQSTDHMVTETLIRGMYKHYRAVMSL